MNEREQLIHTLQATYRTLANQEQWYGKYLQKQEEVRAQERLVQDCKASKFSKGVLTYLSIGASVLFCLTIAGAFMGEDRSIHPLALILVMAVVIGIAVLLYKLGAKYVLQPMADKKAAPLEAQLQWLRQELQASERDFKASLSVQEPGSITGTLANRYYSTAAVGYMLEAVQGMRADTLKEAINLYEEKLHRQKVEQGQQQIMAQQQDLAQAVEQAQRTADAAASAADYAVWASYNNYN